MTKETRDLAAESLRQIAPDIEISEIDPKMDLRDAFDIDSMDFLNLVSRLSKELAVEIPEKDYPAMVASFDALVGYLNSKAATS